MLSEFFAKRRLADLIRGARDPGRENRYECIAELGTLPPTEESVSCLIEISRNHEREYLTAKQAVAALGQLDHPRATEHLVERIRQGDGRIEEEVGKALSHARHARGLPELARIAGAQCRRGDDLYSPGQLIELMLRIDPVAGQAQLESLAPDVLDCALRELKKETMSYGSSLYGERLLARCLQPAGRNALRSFQEAAVQRLTVLLSAAEELSQVGNALAWLKQSPLPGASKAVAEFHRTPARAVTKFVEEVISDDDDPAVKTVTHRVTCSTEELGQPRDREELARRDAETSPQARQAYEQMKFEREHRERIYPELLHLGQQKDLEAYAKACLEEPVYEVFHSETPSGGRALVNTLASFLQKSTSNAKAAELLRLVLQGDRTKLWKSTREALAWKSTSGGWPPEITWKPLALDLLDRTGDPGLDALLITEIEEGRELPDDVCWKLFAKRNPGRLLELSRRLLDDVGATKVPSNSPLWKTASARDLLREALTAKGSRARALDVLLDDRTSALALARELKERGKPRDRQAACLILCLLDGPEIRAELTRWLAEERDVDVPALFARFLSPAPAPPPPPKPVEPPPAPVPAPPPVVPPPPKPRPSSPADLWARVRARLEKLRAIPPGSPTPEEIALHADRLLGHTEVGAFVRNFYYPALYGTTPTEAQVSQVLAWLETFEGRS